ncbi:hypothetical protein GCM10023084_59210 [Streptomyces lacrimifluminis]|uniref:Uncharacterized protein n=1 Tax=Streptomyces lacrimifluminis TaxID=1500077 RepID=A0A917LDD8_9ACTN|nr:hypothetical protein GCM10012282_62160 [Streptomyces lacrimifluminis]
MTPTGRFDGYGALDTGAARGIGAATVRRRAEEDARVLVTDVDSDAAERAATALRELGLADEAFGCDVADRASVEAAVGHTVASFGSLGVLADNAYGWRPDAPLWWPPAGVPSWASVR